MGDAAPGNIVWAVYEAMAKAKGEIPAAAPQ